MKKAFISFLIMTLMITNISLVNISSVQAATTDNTSATSTDNTIKVSLDNIKEFMTENNSDIKSLFDEMKIANETYHDALDTYQDYQDEYDEDDDAPVVSTKPTDETDVNYESELEEYYSTSDALTEYNKWKTAKTAYESDLDAYKTARDAYEEGIETNVYAAQQAYIAYLSDLYNEKLKEDTVTSNEKDNQIYKLQYENGFISKNEYTSSLLDNVTPANELKQLKDTTELARTTLCNTLGISPEKNITFDTNITDNFEMISKIKYEDDLDQMLSNNVDIKQQNEDINDLEDEEDTYDDNDQEDIYKYKLDSANTTLKQLMKTKETDFKEQYNTLITSYNTMKTSYDSLNQEKNDYSIAQVQYDYGFISKNDADDAKVGSEGLNVASSTYEENENTVYVNYLRYLQMKEGY